MATTGSKKRPKGNELLVRQGPVLRITAHWNDSTFIMLKQTADPDNMDDDIILLSVDDIDRLHAFAHAAENQIWMEGTVTIVPQWDTLQSLFLKQASPRQLPAPPETEGPDDAV